MTMLRVTFETDRYGWKELATWEMPAAPRVGDSVALGDSGALALHVPEVISVIWTAPTAVTVRVEL